MKRMGTKRLMTVVLSVVIAAMLSISAFAAYVPTKITHVYSDGSTSTKTLKYSKSGNLTKSTWSSGYSETYKYKNNRLTKVTDSDGYISKLKYTNGALKSITYPDYTTNYKWKGSKAKVTDSDESPTTTKRVTVKKNGKKRIVSRTVTYTDDPSDYSKITYKYYGNGNIKSITYKEPGSKTVLKYNKNGYITSRTDTSGSSKDTQKYKYKMDKSKKCPKSVTITRSDSSSAEHYTFSGFKKVSKSKNCDAWGNRLDLGVNIYY